METCAQVCWNRGNLTESDEGKCCGVDAEGSPLNADALIGNEPT